MVSDELYQSFAVEFARAMVVQLPIDRLATMPDLWSTFCGDVFDLTDAFCEELEGRLAARRPAEQNAAGEQGYQMGTTR